MAYSDSQRGMHLITLKELSQPQNVLMTAIACGLKFVMPIIPDSAGFL